MTILTGKWRTGGGVDPHTPLGARIVFKTSLRAVAVTFPYVIYTLDNNINQWPDGTHL